MPRAVRLAVSLIGIALTVDVIGTLWLKSFSSRAITEAAILICLFGGLLFAIAYRRNWARLTFTFLFVAALPFSLVTMTRALAASPVRVAVSFCLAALQAIGLAFLFTPEAVAWYHHRDRAA